MSITALQICLGGALVIMFYFAHRLWVLGRDKRVLERSLDKGARLLSRVASATICMNHDKIVFASAQACELLDYKFEDILGLNFSRIVYANDIDKARRWFDGAADEQDAVILRIRHGQGHWVWIKFHRLCRVSDSLLDKQQLDTTLAVDAEPDSWCFWIADVSQEQHILDREQRNQRLRGVGLLAAGVAHDFNNLLTVITGYAEHLEQGEAQTKILGATDDAAALVQTLTAFSVPNLSHEPRVELKGAIEDTLVVVRSLAPAASELHVNLLPTPMWVALSTSSATQILTHLVVNAREAVLKAKQSNLGQKAQGDGNIWIDLEWVTLAKGGDTLPKSARPGEFALLTVSDDGYGMSEDVLERAYDPFFSTKQDPPGSGLGLTTVQGLVTKAGGFVTIESQPVGGTSVAVYLPILPARGDDHQRGVVDNQRSLPPQTGRILLIEDDERVAEVVARSLVGAGYSVTIYSNANSALGYVAQERPDLIVADALLPGKPDDGLLSVANAFGKERVPPILLLCGYTPQTNDDLGLPAKSMDFLAKPFRTHELLNRVARLLGHGSQDEI